MCIVAFSCDIYEQVWKVYLNFLNYSWPNHPQVYICTEYQHPDIQGIKFVNYYNSDTQKWNHNILSCIEQINTGKILFMDCDQLIEYVNEDKIEFIYNTMINDYSIPYIKLIDVHSAEKSAVNQLLTVDTHMDALCQACIWNRDALKECLYMYGKQTNPWEWEEEAKHILINRNIKGLQALTDNNDLFKYTLSGCMTHGFWKMDVLMILIPQYCDMFKDVNFSVNDFILCYDVPLDTLEFIIKNMRDNLNLNCEDIKNRLYYYKSGNLLMDDEKVRYGVSDYNKHIFISDKVYPDVSPN